MESNFQRALSLDCKAARAEVWKPIPGFPQYEASAHGQIRSLKRRHIRILKPAVIRGGYLRVTVCRSGRATSHSVHQLVLLAFAGPRPSPSYQVAHNNGDCKDNRPQNLRWATSKQNHADRVAHGTAPRGENNPRAILNGDAVEYIRRNYTPGTGRYNPGNSRKLAAKFGVTTQSIRFAARALTWAS